MYYKIEINWNLCGLDNVGLRKLNQFETFSESWPSVEMAKDEAKIMLNAMSERYRKNVLGLRIISVEPVEVVIGEF